MHEKDLAQDRQSLDIESLEDILNGMYDWVRVLDRDDNIIYVNKAMSEAIKNCKAGQKCYEALGRTEPCVDCTSRKAVFDGQPHEKEEIIGDKIFSVMGSPVRRSDGQITAVVEVLRDITETKRIQKKLLEQNLKLESDLSLARKMQCRLLPPSSPDKRIEISYIYQPCEKLGGDFIDIFKIDENHTGIYIADVSGHGVPASLLTVFLRSAINRKIISPSKALTELHKEFNNSFSDPELYITVFYAIVDLGSKKLAYSNAGHNVAPFVCSKERFELLRLPGIPISNWSDSPSYSEAEISLQKNDRVVLYTDGIVEIKDVKGEQYGEERLLGNILGNEGDLPAVLKKVFDDVMLFSGKDASKIPDDITIALLELK